MADQESITGDKYINGTELATRLGISRSTLCRWVKAGRLPMPHRTDHELLHRRVLLDVAGAMNSLPDFARGQGDTNGRAAKGAYANSWPTGNLIPRDRASVARG